MFGLFKKKNNNDNWSIEKVYNDPDSWFKDLSKEERLKTFSIKYSELSHLDKDGGLNSDNIVITPISGFQDFKLFENFVAAQISKRNKRLGLNQNFWIEKPGMESESEPVFYPKNIGQKTPEESKKSRSELADDTKKVVESKEEYVSKSDDESPYELKEGMIREYILQKQTMSILPFNEETQCYKEAISYNILFSDYLNEEDYENREPIIDETLGEIRDIGIQEIDSEVKHEIVLFEGKIIDYDQILDDLNDSDFEEYAVCESLKEAVDLRDELVSEYLSENKLNKDEELKINEENPINDINGEPKNLRFQIESLKESFNKSIDNVYNQFLKYSRDLHLHFETSEYKKIKPILANLYYVGIKLATISDKVKKDQYQSEVNDLFLGNKCHQRLFGHFLEENRSWTSKIKIIKIILIDKPDFLERVFNEIFTKNNDEILELIKSKKFGIPYDDGEKWDLRYKIFSQKVEIGYTKEGEEEIIIDNIDLIMYRQQAYDGKKDEWIDFDGGLGDIELHIKDGKEYDPSNFLPGKSSEWTQDSYEWMYVDQKTFSYHKTKEEAKKSLNELFNLLVINKEKYNFPKRDNLNIYVFQEKCQTIRLNEFRHNGLVLNEIQEIEYKVFEMQDSFNISPFKVTKPETGPYHLKEDFPNMMSKVKNPEIVDLKFYFTAPSAFHGTESELILNLDRKDFENYIDKEKTESKKTYLFEDKWILSCENCGQDRLHQDYNKCPNCGKENRYNTKIGTDQHFRTSINEKGNELSTSADSSSSSQQTEISPIKEKVTQEDPREEEDHREQEDPHEVFSLTEEMINSIKKDVIPRIKTFYDITTKEEYNKLFDEIDHPDMIQVMDGLFDADEILGINIRDYEDMGDYLWEREELWNEKFYIEEDGVKTSLAIDWLCTNDW